MDGRKKIETKLQEEEKMFREITLKLIQLSIEGSKLKENDQANLNKTLSALASLAYASMPIIADVREETGNPIGEVILSRDLIEKYTPTPSLPTITTPPPETSPLRRNSLVAAPTIPISPSVSYSNSEKKHSFNQKP